jgi:hypothetical protein
MRVVLVLLLSGAALAAEPSPRQACMSDYQKLCAGVSPGGGRIKQCLIDHRAQLSEACRTALDAKQRKPSGNLH